MPEPDDDHDDDMEESFSDDDSSQDLFRTPHPDTKKLEKFRRNIIDKTGPVRCFIALTGKQASYLSAGKARSLNFSAKVYLVGTFWQKSAFCRISPTSLIKAWPEKNCVVTPDDLETFERDIVDAPFTVPGKPEVWSIPSIPYGF